MSDTEKAILDILNRDTGASDDCFCRECMKIKADAEVAGTFCEFCGYKGTFATIECACYDSHCWPSARGGGCFHGGLICPICEDGEKLTDLLQRIRAALLVANVVDEADQHQPA